MPIIDTEKWLTNYINQSTKYSSYMERISSYEKIGEKLQIYFPDATSGEICEYLNAHGMFHPKESVGNGFCSYLKKIAVPTVQRQFSFLKMKWNGPDIPIFIFPVTKLNHVVTNELKNRSGLAFKDKLFLFIEENTSTDKLAALLTHEYNHVCRLFSMKKTEEECTLLDSMIMEGLAEYAVEEQFDNQLLAPWAKSYSIKKAKVFWNRWLKQQQILKKISGKHDVYMYGLGKLPKWMGYNVGYHIVKSASNKYGKNSTELLLKDTRDILEISDFAD